MGLPAGVNFTGRVCLGEKVYVHVWLWMCVCRDKERGIWMNRQRHQQSQEGKRWCMFRIISEDCLRINKKKRFFPLFVTLVKINRKNVKVPSYFTVRHQKSKNWWHHSIQNPQSFLILLFMLSPATSPFGSCWKHFSFCHSQSVKTALSSVV